MSVVLPGKAHAGPPAVHARLTARELTHEKRQNGCPAGSSITRSRRGSRFVG
jgi:hypothetical protein